MTRQYAFDLTCFDEGEVGILLDQFLEFGVGEFFGIGFCGFGSHSINNITMLIQSIL